MALAPTFGGLYASGTIKIGTNGKGTVATLVTDGTSFTLPASISPIRRAG